MSNREVSEHDASRTMPYTLKYLKPFFLLSLCCAPECVSVSVCVSLDARWTEAAELPQRGGSIH